MIRKQQHENEIASQLNDEPNEVDRVEVSQSLAETNDAFHMVGGYLLVNWWFRMNSLYPALFFLIYQTDIDGRPIFPISPIKIDKSFDWLTSSNADDYNDNANMAMQSKEMVATASGVNNLFFLGFFQFHIYSK